MEKRLIFFLALGILLFASRGRAQIGQDSACAVPKFDSVARQQFVLDSLERSDSIYLERELHSKQLANMRHYHLTGDTKPEVLRIEGMIVPRTNDIVLHFTINSASGKILWNERWKGEGYFDPADNLNDTIKLIRVRHVVHAFFANENFTPIDSARLSTLFADASPADVLPASEAMKELEVSRGIVYNVFRSRDYFYGIIWLPSKHKFVRLWKN